MTLSTPYTMLTNLNTNMLSRQTVRVRTLRWCQSLTRPLKQLYTVTQSITTHTKQHRNSTHDNTQESAATKYTSADKYHKHTSALIDIVHGNVHTDKYIIVNKPANLPVQALEPLDSVQTRLTHQLNLHNKPIYFPHRLDKSTSGLLLVVFDRDLLIHFNTMIQNQSIQKQYRAIVQLPSYVTHKLSNKSHKHSHSAAELQSPFLSGSMIHSDGTLVHSGTLHSKLQRRTLPVYTDINVHSEYKKWKKETFVACGCYKAYNSGLSNNKNRLLHPIVPETLLHQSVNPKKLYNGNSDNKPRTATTMFELLGVSTDNQTALYDIALVTGRSHQIRIHLADAGLPIINDAYYNLYYIWQYMHDVYTKMTASLTSTPISANRHTTTLTKRVQLNQQLAYEFATYTRRTGAQSRDRVSEREVYDDRSHYSRAKQRTTHWRSTHDRYDHSDTNDTSIHRYNDQWNQVLNKYGVETKQSTAEQKQKQRTNVVNISGIDEVYQNKELWQPVPQSTDTVEPSIQDKKPQTGTIGWLVNNNDIAERTNHTFLHSTLGLQAYKLSYPHPVDRYKRIEITLPPPLQWTELSDTDALSTANKQVAVRVIDDLTCVY